MEGSLCTVKDGGWKEALSFQVVSRVLLEYNISFECSPNGDFLVLFSWFWSERRLDSSEARYEGRYGWTERDSLFAKWRARNYLGLLTGDEVSGEEFKGRAFIFLTFSLGELLLKVKDKQDVFTHLVTGSGLEPSTLGSSTLKVAWGVLNSVDYSTSSRSNFFLCLKKEWAHFLFY